MKPEASCPWLLFGFCVLMALGRPLFGKEFEQKWWCYLCSQLCWHSWEISSFQVIFKYGVLWYRISSGCRWKLERSCLYLLLPSCVLDGSGRVPLSRSGGLICAHRLVCIPGRTTLSHVFGDEMLWHRINAVCRWQPEALRG